MAFKDHFSRKAQQYTQYRPRYSRELFQFLASLPGRRDCAWDCGTGNGQAAVALAESFAEVIATDASPEQIAQAEPHPRVHYLVGSAEQCPLADESVDLVTVAQALHWFDRDQFYRQVRRVGRKSGAVAAWSYGLCRISPAIDRVVWHLYSDVLGPYWPPERKLTEERYDSIAFPFDEFKPPPIAMTAEWNMPAFIGYVGTWSSVQQFIDRRGSDPLPEFQADLANAWGAPDTIRTVSWPLSMRVGRLG